MATDDGTIQSLLEAVVRERLLDHLSEREQELVRLRFGLKDGRVYTLEEISQEFGLTTERIRQLVDKTLDKLRRLHTAHRLDDSAES